MKLVPNADMFKLPINNDDPDWSGVPNEIKEWLNKFPMETMETLSSFARTFRCGETVSPNPDEPNQKTIRRLRVTIDFN